MATNDFLTFAGDPAADVMTQSQYLASGFTARLLGFSTGTALSIQLNKVWRQASLISHMIGQFTVDEVNQDMLDDGTPAGMTALEAHFRSAITHVAQSAVGTGFLPLVGGTLTGDLTIRSDNLNLTAGTAQNSVFTMTRNAGQNATIGGQTGALLRWAVLPGDSAAEQGANAGSNFAINRYADAGTIIDAPLTINRATGVVNFSKSPTVGGAAFPYLPIAGGNLTGVLGVAGFGITWTGLGTLGTFYAQHKIGFGWDGTVVQMAVDGTAQGAIATRAYVGTTVAGYLLLTGGTLSGGLAINSNLTVSGTTTLGATTRLGNLTDWYLSYDGTRYEYQSYMANYYDYFDRTTKARGWQANTGKYMTLDSSANLYTVGTITCDGSRIIARGPGGTPSVSAYYAPASGGGVCVGLWADPSGMYLGNCDGSGNPSTAHVGIGNGGYVTILASGQCNGSWAVVNSVTGKDAGFTGGLTVSLNAGIGGNLTVTGAAGIAGAASVGGLFYANGGISVAGVLNVSSSSNLHGTAVTGDLSVSNSTSLHATSVTGDLGVSGNAGIGNDMTVGGNFSAYSGTVTAATVASNGYLYANDRLVVKSGYAAIVSWNTAEGVAGVRHVNSGGFNWAYCGGTGDNPQAPSMNLSLGGRLSCSGGVNVSDAKVKHDIAPSLSFDSLAAIRALVSRSFAWNVDNHATPFGFIAGEMREHLPDVVQHIKAMDVDGIDVLALLTHAIRAIQQLADKLERIKA
jgi:Chaperone of endosialidase